MESEDWELITTHSRLSVSVRNLALCMERIEKDVPIGWNRDNCGLGTDKELMKIGSVFST